MEPRRNELVIDEKEYSMVDILLEKFFEGYVPAQCVYLSERNGHPHIEINWSSC